MMVGIDEFCMLWLPWATHRKVCHKMAVWTTTRVSIHTGPKWSLKCELSFVSRRRDGGWARNLFSSHSVAGHLRTFETAPELQQVGFLGSFLLLLLLLLLILSTSCMTSVTRSNNARIFGCSQIQRHHLYSSKNSVCEKHADWAYYGHRAK